MLHILFLDLMATEKTVDDENQKVKGNCCRDHQNTIFFLYSLKLLCSNRDSIINSYGLFIDFNKNKDGIIDYKIKATELN